MPLWRENTVLSETERKKRSLEREHYAIQRTNSFFSEYPPKVKMIKKAYRPNERMESADNRRAAGIYVKNF
mgnify:CR=1 FL=1